MKIAYFDCASGISGDMTLGALLDAGADLDAVQRGIDSLGLPSCQLRTEQVQKKGFRATQLTVEHEPEHAHRHLSNIVKMIEGSELSAAQQELAIRIFQRLGEAEAKVHGTSVEKVHFHEVGAVDSIADIVGVAIAWDLFGIERAVASAVPTGSGEITIAHGRCKVPAPATAELLLGIPLVESSVEAELTTPTGAAILATLVESFGPPPSMTIESIGYGAGQRDLQEQANLLRLIVGTASEDIGRDAVWVLETNLDDVTGEVIGHCTSRLMDAGALDVYTTAIQMKKNRPAVKLTVLCDDAHVADLQQIIFTETATLGIRRWRTVRETIRRQQHSVSTRYGDIEGKLRWLSDNDVTFHPEYEGCRRLAGEHNVALNTVQRAARRAFRVSDVTPPE
jgi:uncharacterized protein (TIGR00299 family) protein